MTKGDTTSTQIKQMYYVVDPKQLPALARRILEGTLPLAVTWGTDHRRIKTRRAEVKRDPYGRPFIEVEGEIGARLEATERGP